jgi:hypothetical protein
MHRPWSRRRDAGRGGGDTLFVTQFADRDQDDYR